LLRSQRSISIEINRKINADTDKIVSEILERKDAKVKEITAKYELEAEKIKAEAKEISNKIIAEGMAQSESIKTEASSYCQKKQAEIELLIAKKVAEALNIEGEAEKTAATLLTAKRELELNMKKLSVLYSLANNPNVSVFGNNNDNLLAQMAAYRITGEKPLPK